ncbi:MAG: hypothetical protein EON55_02330 [Alphaproteobacteria bacterium]|nr:MAG: hypothetical protein EON55_02330 [Alphaproteobacteria bacterium]
MRYSTHRLASFTAALLLSLAVHAGTPARAAEPLRIGIITDMSGQYSDGNGAGSVAAARLAVADFGGSVLGRPIEVVYADHQNKPDVAAGIVRQWLDTGGVDVVAEGVNSTVALAVQGVTRERGRIFLISGAGTSDLTGKECSPTSVQWTYDTYASANATAKTLVGMGGKTWFFLTADYAFGQALQRDATAAVLAAGGTVVGSVMISERQGSGFGYGLTAIPVRPAAQNPPGSTPQDVEAVRLGRIAAFLHDDLADAGVGRAGAA